MSRGSKHLNRLAMPKNWKIQRKGIKYVAKPLPGPHPIKRGIPLLLIFRDILEMGKTAKEVQNILYNQEVLVDGIRRKQLKFIVGLFDIISIPKTGENYLVYLNTKNKFILKPIKDAKTKLCQVKGKTAVKKKIQLNLYDGKNVLVDKAEQKTGDTVVLELNGQKVKETLKFEKGAVAYLTGGKHIGEKGKIKDIDGKTITISGNDKKIYEVPKRYVYIIGKEKALIELQ